MCGPLFQIMVHWRRDSEVSVDQIRQYELSALSWPYCGLIYFAVEQSASPVGVNAVTPTRIVDIVLIKNQKGGHS